jgi:hypothetical protein
MNLLEALAPQNREILLSLTTPLKIQEYLDSLPYVGEDLNRTPLRVMQDRQCHCLDGGMLAAEALSRIGLPPLLLDLVPVPGIDDDHVLAVFRQRGLWGAVAKSNFTGLRYRDPIYRSLRELVMSYFEVFYNVDGIKTLRGYTRPLDLTRFNPYNWQTEQAGADRIIRRLYTLKPIPVVPDQSIPLIARLDQRSMDAAFYGVRMTELYKPH